MTTSSPPPTTSPTQTTLPPLPPLSLTPPPIHSVRDVVITTDIGIGLKSNSGKWADVDDAYAIHSLLLEKYVNVAAIVVQFGNAGDVEEMYDKLYILIQKMNLPHNPVLIRGSTTPLSLTNINKILQSEENQEFIQFVKDYPRQLTVIGIGPATSIAVLMEDEDAACKVDRIYLEMGQHGVWGDSCGFTICSTSVGDFNLRADPVSVNQLIQQVPQLMFFVPFQQILDYTLNMEQLGSYYGGTEAQRWMARRTNEWFKQWTSVFTCEDYIHIWDTTPLLVGSGIVEPRFCNFVQISASVEQCGNTTKLFLEANYGGVSHSWVCQNPPPPDY